MATKATRTPRDLGKTGAALWRSITAQVHADGLELDARERDALESACHEKDILAGIQDALRDAPRVITGAQGQLVAHPLLGEQRRSRQTIASLLKSISLVDPLEVKSGSGSQTQSWQARAAAQARRTGT